MDGFPGRRGIPAEHIRVALDRQKLPASQAKSGVVPYSLLHQVYGACSIYVTPAYAESFAHPLVETMASGLPIAAAGTGVHRKICQDAAVYFQHFSPEELAERVCQIAASDQLARQIADRGRDRSRRFSGDRHVDEVLNLAGNLLATTNSAKRCESLTGTRYKTS